MQTSPLAVRLRTRANTLIAYYPDDEENVMDAAAKLNAAADAIEILMLFITTHVAEGIIRSKLPEHLVAEIYEAFPPIITADRQNLVYRNSLLIGRIVRVSAKYWNFEPTMAQSMAAAYGFTSRKHLLETLQRWEAMQPQKKEGPADPS